VDVEIVVLVILFGYNYWFHFFDFLVGVGLYLMFYFDYVLVDVEFGFCGDRFYGKVSWFVSAVLFFAVEVVEVVEVEFGVVCGSIDLWLVRCNVVVWHVDLNALWH